MLAYAAHQKTRRPLSSSTLTLIVGAHVVALGLLAAAKMETPTIPPIIDTEIYDVKPEPPKPVPPKPVEQASRPLPQPQRPTFVDPIPPVVPIPNPGPTFETGVNIDTKVPELGPILETPLQPPAVEKPVPPVRLAARAITPADLLRPPYPESKRRAEEQASLRLRLSIDARGRVTGVEPVGTADPEFLAAARSHLLRYWRYKPATEDGRAVATTMVVTLRFQLEE